MSRYDDEEVLRRRRLQEAAEWLLESRGTGVPRQPAEITQDQQRWLQDEQNAVALLQMSALVEEIDAHSPQLRTALRECTPNPSEVTLPAAQRPPGWARSVRWLPTSIRRAAVAAVVAATAIGLGLFAHLRWGRIGLDEGVAQFRTVAAEHREIVMSDGSRITLGAQSALTTHYTQHDRVVSLTYGEALFTVTHNATRPFIVLAGTGSIQAVGTAFNVLRRADRVVVTVSDGAVIVAPRDPSLVNFPGPSSSRAPVANWLAASVKSGEGMTYEENGSATAVEHADPKIATAWSEGRLQYLREPLRHVVEDVNRYWHKQIVFDRDSGDLLYTGDVLQTAIDAWTQNLPQIFPVDVTDTDSQHVSIRMHRDAATRGASRQ